MKKLCFLLFVLVLGVNMNAQEGTAKDDVAEGEVSTADQEKFARVMELMGKKIDMEVDTSLFMEVSTNTYVSESPKAVVMAMMIPDSYENSKKKMDKDAGDKFNITEKGETQINGVTALYMKGTSEAEGVTLNNMIYCIEVDAETCLMFMGMVEQNADAKFTDAIKKSMNSVIKKQ
ncbi:hypothetical protein [Psychroserpens damuponensis]|uniref:hypothetical protein n=1 Tax=Psychroserpens damuponensis TaxID=943936 RepID=UPI00058F6FC6|nr:hypothetical protein [Psychroserpens damuponensis]